MMDSVHGEGRRVGRRMACVDMGGANLSRQWRGSQRSSAIFLARRVILLRDAMCPGPPLLLAQVPKGATSGGAPASWRAALCTINGLRERGVVRMHGAQQPK